MTGAPPLGQFAPCPGLGLRRCTCLAAQPPPIPTATARPPTCLTHTCRCICPPPVDPSLPHAPTVLISALRAALHYAGPPSPLFPPTPHPPPRTMAVRAALRTPCTHSDELHCFPPRVLPCVPTLAVRAAGSSTSSRKLSATWHMGKHGGFAAGAVEFTAWVRKAYRRRGGAAPGAMHCIRCGTPAKL